MSCRVKKILALSGPSANGQADDIISALESSGCEITAKSAENIGEVSVGDFDLAVIFGGDGAFLGSARSLVKSFIPLVGINMGRLGFLTEFSSDEFLDYLEDILAGKLNVVPRMMLEINIFRNGENCFSGVGVNEVSILAGSPFRMIELSSSCGGVDLGSLRGDGLIIAGPSGSTGHTLSAGGPILSPSLRALILTPIAAHSLSSRPVVTSAVNTVAVEVLSCNEGTTASIDGQISIPLAAGDRVEVKASDSDLYVIQNPDRPFFSTLRTKLKWGDSPHYQ